MRIFFLIFVVIPILEIMTFITIGKEIGLVTTLTLCLLTAVTGGLLVKWQGLETLMQGQAALAKGSLPLDELFHGLCIVAAGATLITPGFVTDAIGFALLIPPIRMYLKTYITKRFEIKSFSQNSAQNSTHSTAYGQSSEDIVEGEFEHVHHPSSTSKPSLDDSSLRD